MQGYVDVYQRSAARVLRKMVNLEVRLAKIVRVTEKKTADAVSALVGLSGDLPGSLALVMSRGMAAKVAEHVLREPIESPDNQRIFPVILELASIIAGNANGLMLKRGIHQEHTPPTIIEGSQFFIGFVGNTQTYMAPLLSDEGTCAVIVSLPSDGRVFG